MKKIIGFRWGLNLVPFVLVPMIPAIALVSRQSFRHSLAVALFSPKTGRDSMHSSKPYSPYVDRRYPTRVYWGEQHLHTSYSPDAGLVGDRLGPEDAFRFARGEQLRSSSGQLVRLEAPYDWLVVSDHAEYMGLPQAFAEHDPAILKTASGKKWAEAFRKGGKAGYGLRPDDGRIRRRQAEHSRDALLPLYRPIWDRSVDAAERNNKPGMFTAFNGFEWTQTIKGNNLHRIVVFRDGADRTKQVLPFSEFDSTDPEDLWKYMADYEEKTGGACWPSRTTATSPAGRCSPPRPGAASPFDSTPPCAPASSASSRSANPRATARRSAAVAQRPVRQLRALEQGQHLRPDRDHAGDAAVQLRALRAQAGPGA